MLLDPTIAGADLQYATQQAARALELGENTQHRGWFLFCVGMAKYRNGEFPAALVHFKLAYDALETPAVRASIDLFSAMALQKSGNADEARKTFDRAKSVLDAIVPMDAKEWTIEWVDWAAARYTFDEAKGMFEK